VGDAETLDVMNANIELAEKCREKLEEGERHFMIKSALAMSRLMLALP
jgi:hypothetical protein